MNILDIKAGDIVKLTKDGSYFQGFATQKLSSLSGKKCLFIKKWTNKEKNEYVGYFLGEPYTYKWDNIEIVFSLEKPLITNDF